MITNGLVAFVPGGELVALRLPEVKRRTGKGRSQIYRGIARGTFPKPIKLGERASAWLEHEISAWLAGCVAARDGGQ